MPPLPPQLTETWGAAYLQILIALLVFAFGVPALILQVTLPEDVRRIIFGRRRMASWLIIMIWLGLFCLAFVWLLHPCPNGSSSDWQNILAGAIVTVTIALAIGFWWRNLYTSARERIARDLEDSLIKTFRRRGFLEENTLSDLIYLGVHGDPGIEKRLVLEAIDHLAEKVQQSEKYEGDELEDVIRDLETTLTSKDKPGSDRNFSLACTILTCVRNRLEDRGWSSHPDAQLVQSTLGGLGVAAVETKAQSTALAFLEAVASDRDTLFEMGLVALRAERFHIATAALNKLEALAEFSLPLTADRTVNLLGLLAHFWNSGISTRRRAESFLARLKDSFSPSLQECVEKSLEYHYGIARYDTADKLAKMLQDIKGAQVGQT
jgi:hypothetical protein